MRFTVRVIVGDMRPRAALRYAEIGEEVGKILRRHGAAAVGVHRELCWIDAFSHDRAGEEILGQRGAFACFQAPRDDVPAKHVEHDVEMIICPLLRTKQLGVSSPRESHPRSLAEPDVNLSAHPAPITEPPT